MKKIIHHVEAYLEKVFSVHVYGITDLDAAASELKKDSDELSRNILQVLIEEMNEALREDKTSRKEMGLVMKEKDRPRSILTELGEIRFDRDYYYNRNTGSYETPLDQMLSVQQRARIGETISAGLVTKATSESYARSSQDVTGGLVSRQSVRNHILKAPELEKQPVSSEKRQIKVLDIYADEDHVHLQKPGKEKGKKNKSVPLVTVTEGTVKISEGRNATVNPMHFVDEKMDSKDLWASVEGFIDKVYDLDDLETIRIHGDGGSWIKNGLENFPNVEHVLDGYHLQKYLRAISNRFPKQSVRYRINEALAANDRDKVEAIIASLMKECKSEKDYEKVRELHTYLFSNWEAAVNRFREDMTGSCTEGQVSHVLSERFSRNPMGWSEEGLGKLSKLRVFCKNGGKITAVHFKSSFKCSESYKAYAKRCLDEQMRDYDLSWMSDLKERYVFDTASGTQQAIKQIGRIRWDVLN